MGDRTTMKDVFVQCQTGLQGHGKLMKTLHKIYDKTEFEAFWSEFQHYLKYAMIVFKRETAVERMIDFVAKFAPTLCKKAAEKDEDEDDSPMDEDSVADNRLLQEMFDFLLSSHSARERGIRFRCCQLINKLLTNLGEDAQIDDDLYDRLYECMLERLKDKCPMVRYHAVLAMARLQDPAEENCPVIKAYLFLLNCDPNADVRRAVLSSIAPSTKTLASIISRTRDVKDTVRKTAYEVLAEKIHIKALSIASRLQLINEGLKDRSEMVQQACTGKLLQAWIRTVGGNVLDLLRSLDVEDSTDICSRVLETLFKASSLQDTMDHFNILDEKLLVPVDVLNSESALYWQAVCNFIHAMGTEGDEYMEKVMPTAVDFCAYMQRYVDDMKMVEDPEIQLGQEFIIEQLLLIISYMDTADVASKKALESLLHNMLMADHVSHRLVKFIIVQICTLRGNSENLVSYFAETVSEIREPITVVEKDIEDEQKRQINLKIAGIRVQLNQLREDLDTAVKGQDFEKAAGIKSAIASLDIEKNELLQTSEPVREEVKTEKNDPFTLLKCQTIISEMLQQLKLNSVSSTLQMMIESQIVPGIQNEDAEVRNMAMQALGLCCYLSKELLVTYIPLFMQASQIDVEGVRVTALQILFDLLLIYGLEIVDASEGSSNESLDNPQGADTADAFTASSNSDSRAGTASKLVAIICSFLDGESSDLRTCAAEGLSKLLLSGRVVSSKILSHLILLWYNPLSEDDTHLRDCLGTFFPLYALASRSNQEVVEEAFLPTLRTLLNAPGSSPLAEVDVNNVAELLVQLTSTKLLTASQNSTELSLDNPGHDNLSETVCNEILSNPDSAHVKLWVKILNQMDISPDNEVVLKDLRILAYKMTKTVKEKLSIRGLQKFQARINELASKFISDNKDLENIEPSVQHTESADEAEETATLTPKRKRVRGLYSHNMTLAMESESELEIGDDSTVEVDASCLMSRSSAETPSRRSRKNTTTTELAEEDVFLAPSEPQNSTCESVVGTLTEEIGGSVESQDVPAKSCNTGTKEKEKTFVKDKSQRSKSPDKYERNAASPVKSDPKSPVLMEKRKASRSPARVSPEKRIASQIPRRRSQEKRKASNSPTRERKRMSKSPASSKNSSSSPEKRKSSSFSIQDTGVNKILSVKSNGKKNSCKSPEIGNAEKRKSSDSPTPAKKPKDKSSVQVSKLSPVKKTGKFQKPESTNNTEKHAGKSKNINSVGAQKNAKSKKIQSPEKQKPVSKDSDKITGKVAVKHIRKAMPRSASSESPVPGRGVKPDGNDKLSTTKSPKSMPKVSNKIVTETPQHLTRRVSTRSLSSTPDASYSRRKRLTAGQSVAETPEYNLEQKKKAPSSSRSNLRRPTSARPVVPLTKQKVSCRTQRATNSSASDSSPEKQAPRTLKATRVKTASTDECSTSSPDSVKQNQQKKGKAVTVETDEEEESISLKRKARPSRRSETRSETVPVSASIRATPPGGSRTTRSSLSQTSLNSPAGKAPKQPRSGGSETNVSKKEEMVTSMQFDATTYHRSTRAGRSQGSKNSKQSDHTDVTASTRSKSADSHKQAVATPVSNITRSAVAVKIKQDTRPEPGKLKRPLRSKPSDRR